MYKARRWVRTLMGSWSSTMGSLVACAPALQTPILHTRLRAYQLAALRFGLARLEPQYAVASNLAAPKRA